MLSLASSLVLLVLSASIGTRTFNLNTKIQSHRLQWVGHILRIRQYQNGQCRLVVLNALRHIHISRVSGDLLMEVSSKYSWTELKSFVTDRCKWRRWVRVVKTGTAVSVTLTEGTDRQSSNS